VALESAPLTWLESLKPNSGDSWEDLKRAFSDNFQGSMIRAGTYHDFFQVKQEMNETLRSYTRHFFETRATIANITDEDIIFETRATIANITDEDIIHFFQHGLFSKNTYHNCDNQVIRNLATRFSVKGILVNSIEYGSLSVN
jgi:hypothetical protein